MNKILFAVLLVVGGVLGYTRWIMPEPAPPTPDELQNQTDGNPLAVQREQLKAPPMPVLPATPSNEGFYAKGQWRGNPAVGDINNDGHLDLATSVRRWDRQTMGDGIFVYLGDGKGNFREAIEGLDRLLGYGGADLADVDGDGKLDLAYSGHDKTPNVYLNFLDDKERPQWIRATPEGVDTEVICSDVAFGDFDRDGHVDLATLGQFPDQGSLLLFRGNGDGSFAKEGIVIENKQNYGVQCQFRDMDGDGHVELLASMDKGARVYHWDPVENKAVDEFVDHKTIEILGSDLAVDGVDLDGDGKREFLVSGYAYPGHPPLRIYKCGDDGTWSLWGEGLPTGESFFDVSFGRLEKDGAPLLFAGGQWGIQVVEMYEPGKFRSMGRIENSSRLFNVAVGDFDEDGKDDVVWIGQGGVRLFNVHPEKQQAEKN